MLNKDQIAHDLALIWVNNVLNGNLPQLTDDKRIVDEYLAAYEEAMKKLDAARNSTAVQNDQP